MADDTDSAADDVVSVFQGASSSGGTTIKISRAARDAAKAQNAADIAPSVPPPDPKEVEAVTSVFRSPLTSPTPARDASLPWSAKEGEQRSVWDTVKAYTGLTTPHLPWTSGDVTPESQKTAPVAEPHIMAGIRRGVKDVTDTVGVTSTSEQERKDFEAEHGDSNWTTAGRVMGQTAATAGPVGAAGRVIGAGARFIPGAVGRVVQAVTGAAPAATTVGRTGQLAVQGAAAGGAEAGLTSSSSDAPVGEQIALGAGLGALAGPVIGGLTKGADVVRGYVPAVRRDVAELADRLRTLTRSADNPTGVVVPAPQMTTNRTLRIAGDTLSQLPGAGTDAANLARQRGVQRAVAREMGLDADQFGTAEMRTARDNLRADYTAALNAVPPIRGGTPLATDLNATGVAAQRALSDPVAQRSVTQALTEMRDAFRGGPVTADGYRSLTNATDGALTRIEAAAPSSAQPYLLQIRQALRRRLVDAAGPDLAQHLDHLDARYRAMKTVQPLAEKSTLGDISLPGLQQQVINTSRRFDSPNTGVAYQPTRMSEIADASKQFFGHIPESGTTPRSQALSFARDPFKTTAGFLPGLIAGRPLQSWFRGPTFSGRVIDTSLGRPTPDVGRYIPHGLLGLIDQYREER